MPDPDAFVSHDESSTHACPAPGCRAVISNKFAFCRRHWYAVPKPLREAIWASYRAGKAGTVAHIELIQEAADAIGRG